jgi:hypothetical protein
MIDETDPLPDNLLPAEIAALAAFRIIATGVLILI